MLNDAAVNTVFKSEFARASPGTIAAAMRVSRQILKNISRVGGKYIDHLDSLYEEVIDKKGQSSHHMS